MGGGCGGRGWWWVVIGARRSVGGVALLTGGSDLILVVASRDARFHVCSCFFNHVMNFHLLSILVPIWISVLILLVRYSFFDHETCSDFPIDVGMDVGIVFDVCLYFFSSHARNLLNLRKPLLL